MKYFFLAFTAIFFAINTLSSQSIEKKWQFQTIENKTGQPLSSVSDSDFFQLENGSFSYQTSAENQGLHSGNYVHQNNVLVLYYNQPKDTIRHFSIKELTDSTLVFSEKDITYRLEPVPTTAQTPALVEANTLIKSNGFSFGSFGRGVLGMVSLLVIAFLFSSNRKAINWRTVGIGLAAQLLLAFGVLKVPFIQSMFEWVGGIFVSILDFTMAGTEFLFKSFITDKIEDSLITFAVSILPTIIFFSALTSVLFYLGIIQKVVKGLAWLLSKLLKVSGAESLSVAGNIFLGQTESPLMIKAYLEKMNRSEMLLVMVGGMATVAGGVLAAYIRFLGGGDPVMELFYAKHLLAASVMAAPGAIVISKILYPQTEDIDAEIKVTHDDIGSNILDAIANGTSEGLKLAVNVGAMLLVFLAFIAMLNGILQWFGDITTLNTVVANHTIYNSLSLEFILGYILAPVMWLIGVAQEDVALMGQLLGVKLVASEFVGYIQLAELKDIGNVLHLKYEKSVIMATYMLCGFANFASIGIQIGGIGSLAPGQRKTLSEFGIKALIGGTIASLISATIAGMIIG
ncbi:nucleoside transporter C-terminal domain-containing protein [Mangrovimonas sp. DI 80]|uniref:nucleoside transporter C-terminal domain-containing protein n=1 Tax=Mangrovimonas sp. DI 80 TaxID=1779330 RepID=UPI0009788191|nr:nucleoside transporter C-terminal domain-containing protein [Mangrovimonas sp. DI 80]OMP31478.1 Na+ dependent nucleoside transporter [Mangrovimonas sp. DI 80]